MQGREGILVQIGVQETWCSFLKHIMSESVLPQTFLSATSFWSDDASWEIMDYDLVVRRLLGKKIYSKLLHKTEDKRSFAFVYLPCLHVNVITCQLHQPTELGVFDFLLYGISYSSILQGSSD